MSRISVYIRVRLSVRGGKERDYGPRLYSGSGLDGAGSTAESEILGRFQGIVRRAHITRDGARCAARETA